MGRAVEQPDAGRKGLRQVWIEHYLRRGLTLEEAEAKAPPERTRERMRAIDPELAKRQGG